jgi:peptidylprolyl isomerase
MFASSEAKKTAPTVSTPAHQAKPMEELLLEMTTGERARMWTTGDKMAVDGKPVPGIPDGPVCYEVELKTVVHAVEPWKTPPDVAKPPADAKKTALGVFYKVLKTGKGGPHPKAIDTVSAYYAGWTTDGKSFDSTVTPREFPLTNVIKGWTDGLQLMSVGDRYRFWIPVELAYNNAPGKPAGMLVFDIELASFTAGREPPPPPPHGAHPPMAPHQ